MPSERGAGDVGRSHMGGWVRPCGVAEVREGAPLRCEVGGNAYAVFQLGAEHFVIADRCSHGPGFLSEGYDESGQVECPFHGGRFDIRTGRPTAAPCTLPVGTWSARVSDQAVWIQPAGARAAEGMQSAVD